MYISHMYAKVNKNKNHFASAEQPYKSLNASGALPNLYIN